MKKSFLNILSVAFVLTIIGFVMDGDVVKTTMLVRLSEFFLMLGIISLIVALFYFPIKYLLRSKKIA